ncbi:helix-turn-helix domain-containing protein [Microbacterium sp. NPDC086615]|uniref:helix-turn-helix domain-containing protein n=1 Tax=Microbacterium sp. NPDC086615 TaxID=3154865 RepID=UPI00342A6FC8
MSAAGMSASEIATRLGVTPRTVGRWRAELGIVLRPRNRPITEDEKARALAMLQDGASYKEVGRTIGRCRRHLAHVLPGYGWTQEEKGRFGALIAKSNRTEKAMA